MTETRTAHDLARTLVNADRLLAAAEAQRAAVLDNGASDAAVTAVQGVVDDCRREVEAAHFAMVEADLLAADASDDDAVIRAHQIIREHAETLPAPAGRFYPPLVAMEPVQYVGTLHLGPLGAITSPAEILVAVGTDGRVTAAVRTRPSASWLPAVDLELAP